LIRGRRRVAIELQALCCLASATRSSPERLRRRSADQRHPVRRCRPKRRRRGAVGRNQTQEPASSPHPACEVG
jgi:hypothetical protein